VLVRGNELGTYVRGLRGLDSISDLNIAGCILSVSAFLFIYSCTVGSPEIVIRDILITELFY